MKFGLIGENLSHSYSCEIHKAIADYDYELTEIKEKELSVFFEKRDFIGINVTIPYKQSVMQYLDYISDTAKEIGAVNTIVNRNGKLYGSNTDYFGMSELIKFSKIELKDKSVLIFGSGGTSATAQYTAKKLGASNVTVVSRTASDDYISYNKAISNSNNYDVVINTTPVGMFPLDDDRIINITKFTNLTGVIDAVYHPLKTNLVIDALNNNVIACGGLYMLAGQAVLSSSLFLDKEVCIDDILKAYKNVLCTKKNTVLIGMPSCGKTTIGKILAEKLKRDFIDTDELIVNKIRMPISEFITNNGEQKFREIEKNIVSEISKLSGCIIATGGGSVLDADNINSLRRNGEIYFLNRTLDKLTVSEDRPLSSNKSSLEYLYNSRLPLYKKYSDKIIDGNGSIDEVISLILKELN